MFHRNFFLYYRLIQTIQLNKNPLMFSYQKKKKKISHDKWITSSVNYYAVSDVSSPIASNVPFFGIISPQAVPFFVFSNVTSQVVIFIFSFFFFLFEYCLIIYNVKQRQALQPLHYTFQQFLYVPYFIQKPYIQKQDRYHSFPKDTVADFPSSLEHPQSHQLHEICDTLGRSSRAP